MGHREIMLGPKYKSSAYIIERSLIFDFDLALIIAERSKTYMTF